MVSLQEERAVRDRNLLQVQDHDQPVLWKVQFNLGNSSPPSDQCRNSVQGKHLITDELGKAGFLLLLQSVECSGATIPRVFKQGFYTSLFPSCSFPTFLTSSLSFRPNSLFKVPLSIREAWFDKSNSETPCAYNLELQHFITHQCLCYFLPISLQLTGLFFSSWSIL